MKKYSFTLLFLSLAGAIISSQLLVQYYYPDSNIFFSCGYGFENPCLTLSKSVLSTIAGIPIASFGILYYLLSMTLLSLSIIIRNIFDRFCFAVIFPLTVISLLIDILLAIELINMREICSLCIFTYALNLAIFTVLILWYRDMKKNGIKFSDIYSFSIKNKQETAILTSLALIMVLITIVVLAGTYIIKINADKIQPSTGSLESFARYFYTIQPENIPLPESQLVTGNPGAEITIIAFTDFSCSACYKFYKAEQYLFAVFKNKIKVIHFNFPLDKVCNEYAPRTVYPNSCIISRAFLTAREIDFFYEFFIFHFENYTEHLARIKSGDIIYLIKSFYDYKNYSKPEMDKFLNRINSAQIQKQLNNDIIFGHKMNIKAVPTIFINNRRLEGIPSSLFLEHIVKQEIKRLSYIK